MREGNAEAAYLKIKENNPFPGICGRICSAPCEAVCVLNEEKAPIGIRALERFAFDRGCWDRRPSFRPKTSKVPRGKKIAVIGSGPTGLAAAAELAKNDLQVTVFEALDRPGGVLRYGIPEFRIPKKILDFEIEQIKDLGVNIQTNAFVGQTINFEEIFAQGFAAILLATGAGAPQFMDLPGANLGGVYYGEEFLMRVNLHQPHSLLTRKELNFHLGQKITVIGSGNTALDCARAAVRYGRTVKLIFRRTEEEMRVRDEEREFGKQEQIQFEPLVRPLEILPDENHFANGIRCIRLDYADTEGTGKWQLTEVPGSEFILDSDTVIIGIGHRPNSLVAKFDRRLKTDEDGSLRVDEATYMTSIEGVFAAGNIVTNAGPVVEAIAAGKKAAAKIAQYAEKK